MVLVRREKKNSQALTSLTLCPHIQTFCLTSTSARTDQTNAKIRLRDPSHHPLLPPLELRRGLRTSEAVFILSKIYCAAKSHGLVK